MDIAAESDRLLDFAERSRHPHGGFAWMRDDGTPDFERPRELWVSARMTHVFALAALLGRPGAAELVDHGLAALTGPFHDAQFGGWRSQIGGADSDKRAYEHVFVVLAAASAVAAGRDAGALLSDALDVVEARFWEEEPGALADVSNRDWTRLERYRGANANMHGVEAFLAAADVTGDPKWRSRALRMTERLVHDNHPRLNEHFDAGWRPLPDYNAERPADPFRPYGGTVGHWFEWARLALSLDAALGEAAPGWLRADARRLFDAAVREGWDGAGFIYTVDWDGTPVVRDHLHWVLAEAIATAAVLAEDELQRAWWEVAEAHFVDRVHGSWRHELDSQNRPSHTVWDGKPDVYHEFQATLIPRLPLAGSLAGALLQSIARR